jgi:large subunit ribosomal protein L29
MLASDIREMEQADILTRINELEEERFRLKFRGATENLQDPLRLRLIRRDVARLKTVLRERELAAMPAPAGTARSRAKQAAANLVPKKKSAPKAKARTSSAQTTARSAAPKARKQER